MIIDTTHRDSIENWEQFTEIVRSQGCHLLDRLGDFQNAILVAGCQRSGTTMLARIITQSRGMVNYWFGPDDELDAALLLSGFVDHTESGRYCFQTTYINECYHEYFDHIGDYQLIWVVRNPYSVVYSLLNNWPRSALERNFKGFARSQLSPLERWLYSVIGSRVINPLRQACLFYNAKNLQLFELAQKLDKKNLLVVDYDDLVLNKDIVLPKIYQFVGLEYFLEYGQKIHNQSVSKRTRLTNQELKIIKNTTETIYHKAKALVSIK